MFFANKKDGISRLPSKLPVFASSVTVVVVSSSPESEALAQFLSAFRPRLSLEFAHSAGSAKSRQDAKTEEKSLVRLLRVSLARAPREDDEWIRDGVVVVSSFYHTQTSRKAPLE